MTRERTNPIRVAIVEAAQQSREALEFAIQQAPGLICVAALATAAEALRDLPALGPHVILLDVHPDAKSAALQEIAKLHAALPQAGILVRTADHEPETVFRCLMAGSSGYLNKAEPPERLVAAIVEASEGGVPLSPEVARFVTSFFQSLAAAGAEWQKLTRREREVLELLTRGLLKKDIADRLHITQNTVCTHCRSIYEKLHVNSREQAVAKGVPMEALHLLSGSHRPPNSKPSNL